MSFSAKLRRAALVLALVVLCNEMICRNTTLAAQQLGEEELEFGLAGSRQVQLSPRLLNELAPLQLAARFRRQLSIPPGSPLSQQQQQQQPAPSAGGSNVLGFLSELGPQVAQAKSISSLFSSNSQPQQQPSTGLSALNAAALMGQLSEMVKATQERQERMLQATTNNAAQQAGQASTSAAQVAQGGIQSALADIGAGLQRIATNNPNLLPDVKNLYQSVSSKLSSASSSVAQAAAPGQAQFAQGVAQQVAMPQPLPTPSS